MSVTCSLAHFYVHETAFVPIIATSYHEICNEGSVCMFCASNVVQVPRAFF